MPNSLRIPTHHLCAYDTSTLTLIVTFSNGELPRNLDCLIFLHRFGTPILVRATAQILLAL
jgi:hypothetical protein